MTPTIDYGDELRRFLVRITKEVEHPIFVKVGANDGVTDDPCGDLFLANANWKGLLIEPVPYCFEKLQSIYADRGRFTVEQVAVGTASGTAAFYYVSEDAKTSLSDLPSWYDQLGSFDRQHIVKHLNGTLEPFIIAADVSVEPLDAIIQRNRLTTIDFLHIDTEGHDLQVLKSVNLIEYAPLAIFVEHKHLSASDRNEMKSLLECRHDVWDAGADFYAVHRDVNKLMRRSFHPAAK